MPVSLYLQRNEYANSKFYLCIIAGSSSDKEDAGSARYDPSDMVIDMDMSDEDLDDILRGLLYL